MNEFIPVWNTTINDVEYVLKIHNAVKPVAWIKDFIENNNDEIEKIVLTFPETSQTEVALSVIEDTLLKLAVFAGKKKL